VKQKRGANKFRTTNKISKKNREGKGVRVGDVGLHGDKKKENGAPRGEKKIAIILDLEVDRDSVKGGEEGGGEREFWIKQPKV